MEKLIIVGTSTNARHVFRFINDYSLYDVVGFAVNEEYKREDTYMSLPVYSIEKMKVETSVKLFIGLLWNHLNADRKKLFQELKNKGYTFANLISPHARIRGNIVGSNVWIHDNVIIQNDAVIEDNVAIMARALVGANCIIHKHCFLGTNSTIGGGGVLGEQCFVGMNCTVFDDTVVGDRCILGACTAVKRNVPACSVYKTSSDIVYKQYTPEEIEKKLIFTENRR